MLLGYVCRIIPTIYYNRGCAKFDLDQYEDAIREFDNAIFFNPKFSFAYYRRGIAKGTFYLYFRDKYELRDILIMKKMGLAK